ncbi:hypothetical protein OSB04_019580 [Centaurea solstitialis]|uniref:Reverse transcriptase Ty1/copia-type domain-containing protein n=1 Tax=Centaurea solstitialis TaxID=347529 RepID=A0AA38W561_9ASTR|nr:hypothetical protein OSB04_019580 [Centaurea solstitialis]
MKRVVYSCTNIFPCSNCRNSSSIFLFAAKGQNCDLNFITKLFQDMDLTASVPFPPVSTFHQCKASTFSIDRANTTLSSVVHLHVSNTISISSIHLRAKIGSRSPLQQKPCSYTYESTWVKLHQLFLAYTVHKNFQVFQMDIKNAFLNGKLSEEVYVAQTPGFIV